jgi:hypothetical protein
MLPRAPARPRARAEVCVGCDSLETLLQGIDNAEIIDTVHARRQPMVRVSTAPPH